MERRWMCPCSMRYRNNPRRGMSDDRSYKAALHLTFEILLESQDTFLEMVAHFCTTNGMTRATKAVLLPSVPKSELSDYHMEHEGDLHIAETDKCEASHHGR